MQQLAPVSTAHNPSGYTAAQVLDELRGKRGSRNLTFRYELLDSANQKITDLDNVLSCTIEMNWLADIKRKAKFTVRDTGVINFLSNRIKPYIRLNMPPTTAIAPLNKTVTIRAWGAQGGGTNGGLGGYSTSTFTISGGTTLNVYVGGQGQASSSLTGQTDPGAGFAGGYNGGGTGGYYYDNFNSGGILRRGGSGGGASDVRMGGTALSNRIIVAGGGGGESTSAANGGSGGGTFGNNGVGGTNTGVNGGAGGTSSAGGTGASNGSGTAGASGGLGTGGTGGIWVTNGQNGGGPGGGGGGYYGGGGGAVGNGYGEAGAGGGGSGLGNTMSVGTRTGNGRVEIDVDGVTTVFSYTGSTQTFNVVGTHTVLVPSSYVEWPQGVFLLSSPTRNADETDTVTRDVDAYDTLQAFADDRVTDRYTVTAGTLYTTAVSTLLGSIAKNITTSTKTLPVATEWEPGTPKLTIINNLLSAVNYDSLSFDEDGVAIVKPYVAPSTRAEEYTYADNADSVIIPNVDQELDLFSIPNKWVLVVSEPDRTPLTSTYTNNNPSSPTSTVQRGRTIVDFRTEQEAADQASLDAKVARLAFEASQIFEGVDFTTAVMPIHSGNDVYHVTYSALAIDAKYSEQSWSMPLVSGGQMKHHARRVVNI